MKDLSTLDSLGFTSSISSMSYGDGKLVSVIMPSYNSSPYICDAIQSIINQTYQNWELLVMDDCSTDNTASIVQLYQDKDQRVQLNTSTKNLGISNQMNKGFNEARGEYICRMDSDDIVHPERIMKQVLFMEASPELGLCTTSYATFQSRISNKQEVKSLANNFKEIQISLLKDLPICGASMFFRKKILIKYSYDNKLILGEDYDIISRIGTKFPIANIPETLYYYRKHDKNITNNEQAWKSNNID